MNYIFIEDYDSAKAGQIVTSCYFNYDYTLIYLLLDAKIIDVIK